MQAFGIGLPELLLILILTVVVVGPERLPEVAAQLARFIRRARSYAQYVAQDFNQVVAELEKEVGATREDWKEIASVVGGPTAAIARELEKVGSEFKEASDLQKLGAGTTPSNVVPIDSAASRQGAERDATAMKEDEAEAPGSGPDAEAEAADIPWYVPGGGRRRRGSGDGL